ncbi:GDSL-type esterase/lipase family protein [Kribbella sp. NPDC058245]|uniref:GDSL-type esterase/lipase family protein n=1 Tax=Kribbella sp. NPDC058245 TaxID=3346399 RepID=UPI0036E17D15
MITTPITSEILRGALELEQTDRGVLPHRVPAWARRQYDGQLQMVETQSSGVRLVFRTEATVAELETVPTKRNYAGGPPRPDGVYDVLVDGTLVAQGTAIGGDLLLLDLATGGAELTRGEPVTQRFDLAAGSKLVEIWLPHDETTELVALRTDAPVEPVPVSAPVWLHHGSSISHGSNATHPTAIWPALVAAEAGVELLNLGFGGSARLQPFFARMIRDTPADLISVKLGINIVNADEMRLGAFTPAVHGLLDTIREGHPTTPLLVVSAILAPIHEDTPGPTGPDFTALAEGRLSFAARGNPEEVADGKLSLNAIRTELARIVAQRAADDPNLHYLDGRELYGVEDNLAHPLADNLHPDEATHQLIADRFSTLVFSGKGPFAGRSQVH